MFTILHTLLPNNTTSSSTEKQPQLQKTFIMSDHSSSPVAKATPTKAAAAAVAGEAILYDILKPKSSKSTPSKHTKGKSTPSKPTPSKATPSKAAPSKATDGTVAIANKNGRAKNAPSLR